MSAYADVHVEGHEDIEAFITIFPDLLATLKNSGGREKVTRNVEKEASSYGVIDRDFMNADQLRALHARYGQRLAVLERFCTESYLVEPKYLLEFAKRMGMDHHPKWASEEEITAFLLQKGQELCSYAAANEFLSQSAELMQYRTLTGQFKDFPIRSAEEIRTELTRRFENLPTREQLEEALNRWQERAAELAVECQQLAGVYRWIDGKVLLQKVIYQEVRDFDFPRFARYRASQLLEELANIAREDPPVELRRIFVGFGALEGTDNQGW